MRRFLDGVAWTVLGAAMLFATAVGFVVPVLIHGLWGLLAPLGLAVFFWSVYRVSPK